MAGEVGNGVKKFTRIPAKWKDYSVCGKVIPRERLVSFKTPLSEKYHCTGNEIDPEDCLKKEEEFTPTNLCGIFRKRGLILGLVVDFTNTKRYYDAKEFTNVKIEYKKIKCEGKIVPPEKVVHRFKATVLSYLRKYPDSASVVGIHCTHGLNRAGYIVCRYLIECRGYSPQQAIEAFNKARGHEMERENYLEDLLQRKPEILSEEDIERLIETSPPTDDENKPDRYWKRDYRHEYRDYRPRYRDYRHDYRDPRGYKGGKRGYQWTSEDYNMKHGDYTSGYDGDVNYEDERVSDRPVRGSLQYQNNHRDHYTPHMDQERFLGYDQRHETDLWDDRRHGSRSYSRDHESYHKGRRRHKVDYWGEEDYGDAGRYHSRYRSSVSVHDERDKSNYRERDDRDRKRMRKMPNRNHK